MTLPIYTEAEISNVLMQHLPEAVLVLHPDGDVVYGNSGAEELLGYGVGELEGQPVTALIPPQPGQRVDAIKWLARWADEPHSPQLRFLHLTGQTRSGQVLRLAVRVAKQIEPELLYVVTLRDVSDEQRHQTDIKHAYLLTSRILAISEDAILNIDEEQRISFFNKKAEELFGYAASEVLGQSLDKLLPQRFRSRHHDQIEGFAHSKEPSRMMGERGEIHGLSKSGEEFPLEVSITKVFIEGVPTFSAHIRDIRERKKAERALQESEQRLRAIFDYAVEAVALLSPSGEVIEFNSAAKDLIGIEQNPRDVAFWSLPWWPSLEEKERLEAEAEMQESVLACAAGEEVRSRVEFVDRSGATHHIDFSMRPVVLENETIAVIAEGRDLNAIPEDSHEAGE